MATEAPSVNAAPGEQIAVVGVGASGLGAALAAAFAGFCCIGPASVALLGVGGAVAAAGLKPYRPILLLASLALIAFGFWRAYGRRTMVNGASCPIRVGRFARTVLWVSAVIWVVAAVLPTS